MSDTTGLVLNGVPVIRGTRLQLVPEMANQSSAIWFETPVPLTAATRFSAYLRFQIASVSGRTANQVADGLAFVVHNDKRGTAALGPSGGALGYGKIAPSVALEVDTWSNAGDPIDDTSRSSATG